MGATLSSTTLSAGPIPSSRDSENNQSDLKVRIVTNTDIDVNEAINASLESRLIDGKTENKGDPLFHTPLEDDAEDADTTPSGGGLPRAKDDDDDLSDDDSASGSDGSSSRGDGESSSSSPTKRKRGGGDRKGLPDTTARVTLNQRDEVLDRCIEKGESIVEVANQLNINYRTVQSILRRFKLREGMQTKRKRKAKRRRSEKCELDERFVGTADVDASSAPGVARPAVGVHPEGVAFEPFPMPAGASLPVSTMNPMSMPIHVSPGAMYGVPYMQNGVPFMPHGYGYPQMGYGVPMGMGAGGGFFPYGYNMISSSGSTSTSSAEGAKTHLSSTMMAGNAGENSRGSGGDTAAPGAGDHGSFYWSHWYGSAPPAICADGSSTDCDSGGRPPEPASQSGTTTAATAIETSTRTVHPKTAAQQQSHSSITSNGPTPPSEGNLLKNRWANAAVRSQGSMRTSASSL